MPFTDRELFARLIQCEAGGEGDNGMRAVASVVMNRVNATTGEYARVGQGSLRNIILQPGQFVCASETERGRYNPQNIYNMRPEQILGHCGQPAAESGASPLVFQPIQPYLQGKLPQQGGVFCDKNRRPLLL